MTDSYPEIFPKWELLVREFVKDARKSPRFDFEKTVKLMNDQEGLIKLLLKYAKDTFPLYFVPPYTERNWIPIILNELNEKQNSYIELNVQLFEDGTPMAKSDKKPCGCHIDDDACIPDWHPPPVTTY